MFFMLNETTERIIADIRGENRMIDYCSWLHVSIGTTNMAIFSAS